MTAPQRPPTVPAHLAARITATEQHRTRLADPTRTWLNDPQQPEGCTCHSCTWPAKWKNR